MIGGWQLSRKPLEKVMYGSQKDGFRIGEEYFSAMTVDIILELNCNLYQNRHLLTNGVCFLYSYVYSQIFSNHKNDIWAIFPTFAY